MNASLAPKDRDRLAKLLGLLGSAHAGERAAAGAKAHELIRKAKLTWVDVLSPLPAAGSPSIRAKSPPKRVDRKTALWCLETGAASLTEWETAFCRSVAGFRRLSPKQRAVLTRLRDRILADAA